MKQGRATFPPLALSPTRCLTAHFACSPIWVSQSRHPVPDSPCLVSALSPPIRLARLPMARLTPPANPMPATNSLPTAWRFAKLKRWPHRATRPRQSFLASPIALARSNPMSHCRGVVQLNRSQPGPCHPECEDRRFWPLPRLSSPCRLRPMLFIAILPGGD